MPNRVNRLEGSHNYGATLSGKIGTFKIGHDVGSDFVRRHSGKPSVENESDGQDGKPEEVKPEEEVRASVNQRITGLKLITA